MTTPVEEFTIALAKASKRGWRILRKVRRDIREDVLQMAVAWCWEHREDFDPEELSLEEWFGRAVRNITRNEQLREQREALRTAYVTLSQLERSVNRSAKRPESDALSWASKPPIDHEIEKLLSGPRVGMKDCPPCWRCMYFEGWTPNMSRYKVPTHVDPEIEQALREIERRKINIGFGREPDDNVWSKL